MEINQNSNSTSQSNHNSRNRITSNMVINHNQTSSYYHTKKALWNKVEQKNTKKTTTLYHNFSRIYGQK